ncbi:MAG: aminopeptidase P family protein [Clostridia bacterium]|nr:aminopeptidase P family protein [Clostridia bacterium]
MYTKLNAVLETVDAILVTSPHNMRYFSGFSGGEGAVWISKDKRIVYTDSRYTESAQSEASDFQIIETNNWMKEVGEAAKCNAEKLAFEDRYVSAAECEQLKKSIGKTMLAAGSEQLEKLRMVKTEDELKKLRQAEKISCRAFEYILGVIKPGMREIELAAELEYYMKKNGGEGISFDTIAISGARTSLPHGTPTDKKIEKGDFVTMDFGCTFEGYCADMTRTIVVGKASDEQKKIYNTVKAAQQTGLDFIRAKVTGREADASARAVIEKSGCGEYFRHSLGHGIGILVHELPNLSPKSEIVLEENMVVSCEPGVYIPGVGGVRIEDMVCVKVGGNENFTDATKELIEL